MHCACAALCCVNTGTQTLQLKGDSADFTHEVQLPQIKYSILDLNISLNIDERNKRIHNTLYEINVIMGTKYCFNVCNCRADTILQFQE